MSIQINRFFHISVFGFGQGQLDFLVKNSCGIYTAMQFITNNFPGIERVLPTDFVDGVIKPKCEYLEMVDGNSVIMDGEVQIVLTQLTELECLDSLMDFNPQFGEGYQLLQTHFAIVWTPRLISVGKDMVWTVIL